MALQQDSAWDAVRISAARGAAERPGRATGRHYLAHLAHRHPHIPGSSVQPSRQDPLFNGRTASCPGSPDSPGFGPCASVWHLLIQFLAACPRVRSQSDCVWLSKRWPVGRCRRAVREHWPPPRAIRSLFRWEPPDWRAQTSRRCGSIPAVQHPAPAGQLCSSLSS